MILNLIIKNINNIYKNYLNIVDILFKLTFNINIAYKYKNKMTINVLFINFKRMGLISHKLKLIIIILLCFIFDFFY